MAFFGSQPQQTATPNFGQQPDSGNPFTGSQPTAGAAFGADDRVIDFEGILEEADEIDSIPSVYAGLEWEDVAVVGSEFESFDSDSIESVLQSGFAVGFTGKFLAEASFSRLEGDDPFDLASGSFGPLRFSFKERGLEPKLDGPQLILNDPELTLQGVRDGEVVGTATAILGSALVELDFLAGTADGEPMDSFTGTFRDLDEVRIDSTSGTQEGEVRLASPALVAMDDLALLGDAEYPTPEAGQPFFGVDGTGGIF